MSRSVNGLGQHYEQVPYSLFNVLVPFTVIERERRF